MNLSVLKELPNVSVLEGPRADGRGNTILRFEEGKDVFALKLYRRRWPLWQEYTAGLISRMFHGKTGRSAGTRFKTERKNLEIWSLHGFDVFQHFDKPLPEGIDPPGLWLEYCPGRILSELLRDGNTPWEEKRQLLYRLGETVGRRHLRAMKLSEPLLVQEHPTTDHILLYKDRMITFDLEGAFLPGFPLREALAQELSGYLRSIARNTGERLDEAIQSLAEGYPSKDLLRKTAEWGVSGGTVLRRLKRLQDRRRRPLLGKTEMLRRLLGLLVSDQT